jgi:hypothetical protein
MDICWGEGDDLANESARQGRSYPLALPLSSVEEETDEG